jgi:hypothetical protein
MAAALLISALFVVRLFLQPGASEGFEPIFVAVICLGVVAMIVAAVRHNEADTSEPEEVFVGSTPTATVSDDAPSDGMVEAPAPPQPVPRQGPSTETAAHSTHQGGYDAFREQERLAQALGRYRCFYRHGDEILGPLTLWQVREMIEADLFDPDVPVILEGTDSWLTYAEQELRIAPPARANVFALQQAARMQCFYRLGNEVAGPVSLLVIFHKIRLGELPPGVEIRGEATDVWEPAPDVKDMI